ncbi:nitroreductase family protein [Beduinella massiliensis]|uniref:nitroreductase family protein n=1 Tax=Beduinella massiliensis TaxID=1852363 RepID=UPI000C84C94C
MNAVLENIMTRRSCRAFEKRHIPKEDLEKILTAAVYAPTAMNRQTWRFTVLTDEKKIAELAVAVGRAISRADYDFYKPDALVIVSNLRENANACADAGCAMQNMMLQSHALGVASCWINQMKETNGDAGVRALLNAYGIPEGHDVQCCLALGYGKPAREIEHSMSAVHYV